ncbi:MAG: phenylalanine--tRNA ligase subunit alpha [Candidatus Uhrbacteria bacterium]|nr:phenylalanine--tRNA ligase subunit alpha [Candidatus Uhrbacteria bacterium]
MTLADQIQTLAISADQAIKQAKTLVDIEALEIRFLGRKGELTTILKGLATVSVEDRPKLGAMANEVKILTEKKIHAAKERLGRENIEQTLAGQTEDVTEPGIRPPEGHLHLVTQAIEEITQIFERVGFTRTRYPEVEWDWYAFEALNMPKDHPARDEWETFFMDAPESKKFGKMILTPHATSGTARILAEKKFPIRAINIAKTYRRQMDITHTPMFHQFDGVYVDKGVGITHLLGILDYFVKQFFGPTRQVRIRPFHFRFTEPSFEMDVSCGVCGGTGMIGKEKCRTCKRGWLELGGCGLLHPNVLKAAGVDSSVYSGVAFGWGVERNYMMKEGMKLDDLRMMYKNDLRFLQQF